jgi:ribosomal protein S18 acetylase RimI-like enzyme
MRIRQLMSGDRAALLALLRHVDIFEPHEIRVAEELIDERLAGGADYLIYVAEEEAEAGRAGSRLVGFICHGHNTVTDAVHDIYWIAVEPGAQRRGTGRTLLRYVEDRVREMAGRAIRIETSSQPQYRAARRLYEACGYSRVAEIPDFYKPGDAMCTYMKVVRTEDR